MMHVLICSLGFTPAVVTETLWAMMHPPDGETPIVCDVVHIVTTGASDMDWTGPVHVLEPLRNVVERLMPGDAEEGYTLFAARRLQLLEKINELYEESGHPPPNFVFEAVRDRDGVPIADITTGDHNVLFAEHMMRIVLRYARKTEEIVSDDPEAGIETLAGIKEEDEDTIIHLSLAGGRKTMSSNAQFALTAFGRIHDRLTHVLVRPEALERNPSFWWPGHGDDECAAEIELVPVPFIPLQLSLPKALGPEQVSFEGVQRAGLLEMADRREGTAPVIINLRSRTVSCREVSLKLTGSQMEALAFLAAVRLQDHRPNEPNVLGEGWVAAQYSPGTFEFHCMRATANSIKRTLVAAEGGNTAAAESKQIDRYGELSGFRSAKSKLLTALRESDLYLASRLRVKETGFKGQTGRMGWRLELPPEQIILRDGNEDLSGKALIRIPLAGTNKP